MVIYASMIPSAILYIIVFQFGPTRPPGIKRGCICDDGSTKMGRLNNTRNTATADDESSTASLAVGLAVEDDESHTSNTSGLLQGETYLLKGRAASLPSAANANDGNRGGGGGGGGEMGGMSDGRGEDFRLASSSHLKGGEGGSGGCCGNGRIGTVFCQVRYWRIRVIS